MKLGMITQWYDPEGSSAALPGVISRSLLARGHDVHVLTGFPNYPSGIVAEGYSVRPYQQERMLGINVHRAPLWANHDQSGIRRALNYFSFAAGASAVGLTRFPRTDANLVHLTPATVGLAAMALKARHRTPFVVHVQDLWPDTVLNSALLSGGSKAASWALHQMCDRIYRAASAIAVTSPGMAESIVGRGVDPSKVSFVPNWTDEKHFAPRSKPEHLLRGLGLESKFVVMYAGNFGEYQRLDLLLEAALKLRDHPKVQFLLVGSGVAEARLKSFASSHELKNVHFLPPQPFDSMGDYMAMADLHYIGLDQLPLFEKTIPSKVQATLCAGGAIIGAIGGDAAKIIRRAGSIVLDAPTGEAVAEAILDTYSGGPKLLDSVKNSARAMYEESFSEESSSNALIGLLDEAARGGARS